MKCAIMQPTYLSWLGYFDIIRNVDIFVIYDHVQFEKRSWQQRNRIRLGDIDFMLTIPVVSKSKFDQPIKDVKIDKTQKYILKHLNSIRAAYCKSLNYDILFPDLVQIYNQNHDYLIDLNINLIQFGMDKLGIITPIVFSSDLNVQGKKVDALIDICLKLNADQYLSPPGSKCYIDENNIFSDFNIDLSYQEFDHPVYDQLHYSTFITHLSFIDYLFNVDLAEAKKFGSIKRPFQIEAFNELVVR